MDGRKLVNRHSSLFAKLQWTTLTLVSILIHLANSESMYDTDLEVLCVPKNPPQVNNGSFECVTSSVNDFMRDVFIYWKDIDDNEKCGDIFEYQSYYMTVTNNKSIVNYCTEMFENRALFVGLSNNMDYEILVYSANVDGLSDEHSTVFIPRKFDRYDQPLILSKIKSDEPNVYQLSWKNDGSKLLTYPNKINYYTIYWCETNETYPLQCDSYLDWINVTTISEPNGSYNVTVPDSMKNYQFAISVDVDVLEGNYKYIHFVTRNTGLIWESCTMLENKDVGNIKNVWISAISSTSAILRWKLDCVDKLGLFRKWKYSVCPMDPENRSFCIEQIATYDMHMLENLENTYVVRVFDLKPSTKYAVAISVMAINGRELFTDSIIFTTL